MKKIASKSPKTPRPGPVKPAPASTPLAAANRFAQDAEARPPLPPAPAVKGLARWSSLPKPDTVVATTIIAPDRHRLRQHPFTSGAAVVV